MSSWETKRLGALYRVRDQRAGDLNLLPLLSVSQSLGVIPRERLGDSGRAENLANYKLCYAGDLVINRMSAYHGALGVSKQEGIVSPDYVVLEPNATCDVRFLAAWLKSHVGQRELTMRLRGIGGVGDNQVRTPRINERDLRAISTPLPDLYEQRAIADYLDRETAQIDTLIAEQQRLIELLKERRQMVISQATVGDQNPLSPPSGWPTVGQHWQVVLGKMLDSGKNRDAHAVDLPYLRAGNLQDSGLDLAAINVMPFTEAEVAHFDLRKGDLLVVEGGAVGTNVALVDDLPGMAFQKTINRLRPRDGACSAWLGYILRCYRDAGVIDIICNKSTIPHLTAEKLRALRIPPVDYEDQWEIASWLDIVTQKIDSLIQETERLIELARERRAALITAAVTGQIEIPGAA